jgi:hypothetical protein
MSAASFTATNHGGTETRRKKRFGLRAFVSPWFVIALLAVGCGDDKTPTTPSNTSSTKSETWSSTVAPGGQSSRSFTVDASGTITVTLTAAGAPVLGLGVGLPRTTGGGCRLGVSVNASAGTTPQISTNADAGQYCVEVYDLGTITDPVGFAVKIDHP